ncbi:YbaN family protein [Silanimonas algicola]
MWNDLRRGLWIALAYTALGLGVIGVVLPGLPTTPFILVAAWAAAKSSRRLHQWLLDHRLFGPMVRDWQARGAVSRKAKRMAVLTMSLCAVLMFATAPAWWMAATGTACMAVVAIWLWRRPE